MAQREFSLPDPLGTFSHFYIGYTQRTDHIKYPNGQNTSFDYYPASGDNRLKIICHLANGSNPTSILSEFDYTYLNDGNIATWQKQFGAAPATQMTLGYDFANQLTSAVVAPVVNLTLITQRYNCQYDKASNHNSDQSGSATSAPSTTTAIRFTERRPLLKESRKIILSYIKFHG